MPQKIKHSIIVGILVFPVFTGIAHACEEWAAKLASGQGQVEVQRPIDEQWQPAERDLVFCRGDKVRTGKRSRAVLLLNNQSLVTLDQNSTLIFSPPEDTNVPWILKLMQGSGFFRSREKQRLNIGTPFINAVHEGTEFLVEVSGTQARVSVFDGRVAAFNSFGTVTVNAGQQGLASMDQPPRVQALKIALEDAVQWTLYYPPIIDNADDHRFAAEPSLQHALSFYRQGQLKQALEWLDTIVEDRRSAGFWQVKTALLLTVGRVDEAEVAIDRLQQINPNDSNAFALQAIIAIAKNQQNLAMELAGKAAEADPHSATAKIALSYAYQALFNIDQALLSTQEAVKLAPHNALVWARLSELHLSVGDRDAAFVAAQKAKELNPQLAKTQAILGFANLSQTDIKAAEQAFSNALSQDSSDPIARLGLGLAKIRKGRLEAGTTDLETAVNLDPNNAVLRSYLGKAYYEMRNQDYADTEFKLAKEMDPNDPTPWFYDAILKQTTNRPVEALRAMQKAIELNDNRGVYRSRLLLDEDIAMRSAGLGRIYNDLGFEDIANRQAIKSLAKDPSNYTANRLLSDSYAKKPRHEIAQASSLLQAQLMQPLNYNSIQPRLAYTDLNIARSIGSSDTTYNEYSRVFERNDHHLTATGLYASNQTIGNEALLSGIVDNFSYSLGQMHYETGGFRKNNDLRHDIYNVFAQYQILPELSIQGEFRYRNTRHGDLELKGSPTNFNSDNRRSLEQSTYRFGLKYSPFRHSTFLTSFIYADRDEDLFLKFPVDFPFLGPQDISSEDKIKSNSYQFESQYIFKDEYINLLLGGGINYSANNQVSVTDYDSIFCLFGFVPSCQDIQKTNSSLNQDFVYLYTNLNFSPYLHSILGLSFDSLSDDGPSNVIKINQFSPKLGFIWTVHKSLDLRAAYFQTVKSAIFVNQILQPTQIAGFNQFYDDINGTRSDFIGVGIDYRYMDKLFAGLEITRRNLDEPFLGGSLKRNEDLFRGYFNWTPLADWAVSSEFRYEGYQGGINTPDKVKSLYVPTTVSFFSRYGFFSNLGLTFVNQEVKSNDLEDNNFQSNFFLLDSAMGFKFPGNYGQISFEAKNLLNKNFYYRDRNFQMNETRGPEIIPDRILMARITFNF